MKKIMHSRAVTALLFLLALVLLSVGTIGGTQAALSIRSRDYDTSCAPSRTSSTENRLNRRAKT